MSTKNIEIMFKLLNSLTSSKKDIDEIMHLIIAYSHRKPLFKKLFYDTIALTDEILADKILSNFFIHPPKLIPPICVRFPFGVRIRDGKNTFPYCPI